MSEETRPIVVLEWHEGMTVPIPKTYKPRYVDVGAGHTIEEKRFYYIAAAVLAEHPESERLQQIAWEHPGLDMEKLPSGMIALLLHGEPIGLFDPKLLDATLTPDVVVDG